MTGGATIPCAAAILTHNSAESLPRALKSVKRFSEVLICDGYSTDHTREIAAQHGARIIDQDRNFLNSAGRIIDYAGVRNQTLAAAREQWFLFLDSDEYLSDALIEEIAGVVAGEPVAYWMPRTYVLNGTVIDCASTYPNRQLRLFHVSVVERFIKEVHERIAVREGVEARTLRQSLMTPLPSTPAAMVAKWRGYLAIEKQRRPAISLRRWMLAAVRETAVAGLLSVRMVRGFFCRGVRLPLRFEIVRLWYQWRLVADSLQSVSHF